MGEAWMGQPAKTDIALSSYSEPYTLGNLQHGKSVNNHITQCLLIMIVQVNNLCHKILVRAFFKGIKYLQSA